MMSNIFYFVFIFALLTSSFTFALPFLNIGKDDASPNNANGPDVNERKLIEQTISTLDRWLALRTSKIFSKITEIDFNFNKKMYDCEQTVQYKFDILTKSVTTLQHHWTEFGKMQQQMKDHKHDLSDHLNNIADLNRLINKMESDIEYTNKTLALHIDETNTRFSKLINEIHEYYQVKEDVKSFREKTENDLNILTDKISEQELVIGKLMDNAASSSQKGLEIQKNVQHEIEWMSKSIDDLKTELDRYKIAFEQQVNELKDQFFLELNVAKKKISDEITNIHLHLSSSIQDLNETIRNSDIRKEFEAIKKKMESLEIELVMLKKTDHFGQDKREDILRELFLQKQEIIKQAGVIKSIKDEINVLISFPGFKNGFASKRNRNNRRNFNITST